MREAVSIVVLLALIMVIDSCNSTSPKNGDEQYSGISDCLGSIYPDRGVINPDDPQYEDNIYTFEQVRQMFAQAKQENSRAYRAYKAAYTYSHLANCAFCACGCSESSGHLSAVDCFKDIHGFG